jgi:hypothetical protein
VTPSTPQPSAPWWSQPHVIALVAALLGSNGLQLYSASGKVDPATAELLATDKIERLRDSYDECREERRYLRATNTQLRDRIGSRDVPDVAAPAPEDYEAEEE